MFYKINLALYLRSSERNWGRCKSKCDTGEKIGEGNKTDWTGKQWCACRKSRGREMNQKNAENE